MKFSLKIVSFSKRWLFRLVKLAFTFHFYESLESGSSKFDFQDLHFENLRSSYVYPGWRWTKVKDLENCLRSGKLSTVNNENMKLATERDSKQTCQNLALRLNVSDETIR